jgi:hypothetical protein
MWLYHVPFTICVVSVLKIAFCDKKKEPNYFLSQLIIFFSSILLFLTKRGRQVCIDVMKCTRFLFKIVWMVGLGEKSVLQPKLLFFCVAFCLPIFVFLAFSDYSFGIFKLFVQNTGLGYCYYLSSLVYIFDITFVSFSLVKSTTRKSRQVKE